MRVFQAGGGDIEAIDLEVENLAAPAQFVFRLNGARGRLEKKVHLAAKGHAKIVLDVAELPLALGSQPSRELSSIGCLVYDPAYSATD